jgi:hypothetical protein
VTTSLGRKNMNSKINWQLEYPGLWSCSDAEVFITGGVWVWIDSTSAHHGGPFKTATHAKRDFERWVAELT